MSSLLNKIENKLGMGHHDTTTHGTNTTTNTNVTSTPGSSMTGGAAHMGREQMATGTHGATTESGAAMTQTAVSGSSTGANSITGQHVGVGAQVGSHLHNHHHATGVAHTQGAVAGGVATQHVQDEAYVTRAEERLVVGKETVGAGVAQLHKYVTTEHVGTAVPVLKERAVIEREVIPVGERVGVGALGANAFQEQHIAVALTNEVAVGRKEEVPIERVRLRKEVEVGEQLVEADLRKEHIEVTETAAKVGASGVGLSAEKRLEDAALANRNTQLRQ